MGKKKIAIKRIDNTKTRDVTFSKRRTGLFKKAATACKLYDSEIAIIVFSPVGRLYTFGHSSVDSVIDRFRLLSNNNSLTRSIDNEEEIKDDDDQRRKLKKKNEDEVKKNEDEVITREEMVNRGGGDGHGLCSSTTSNLLYLRDGDGYSWPSQEDWNSIPFTSCDE